jgi:ammonium transporter, Amt family
LCRFGGGGAYFVCGFAIQGFPGGPAHWISAGGKPWNWIAAQPLFLRGLPLDGSPACLILWLQLLSVALAALIPLGAGLDRWRLGAVSASTALLAGLVYPLFAHWVWGGGWLAQIGFVDAAGSAPVQGVGGLTALAIAWILGPRRGKYSSEGGLPAAIPGHNAVLVLFACFLVWTGWLGLNGAGAMLFGGASVGALVRVGLNTTLSAVMAGLAAAAITRTRFGRPDASLCANGWIGGLAASSAGCLFFSPRGGRAGRLGGRRIGRLHGRVAGHPRRNRRPHRLDFRSRHRRHLGRAGARLLCPPAPPCSRWRKSPASPRCLVSCCRSPIVSIGCSTA